MFFGTDSSAAVCTERLYACARLRSQGSCSLCSCCTDAGAPRYIGHTGLCVGRVSHRARSTRWAGVGIILLSYVFGLSSHYTSFVNNTGAAFLAYTHPPDGRCLGLRQRVSPLTYPVSKKDLRPIIQGHPRQVAVSRLSCNQRQ